MKNLLNNRWFIVGLGVVAVLMLAHSVMQPFTNKPEFVDDIDDSDWLDSPDISEKAIIGNISLKNVSTNEIFWNTHPRRDPFSSDVLIDSKAVRAIQNQAQAKSGDISNRQPVLSALVAGPVSRFAIINGQIVQEGDQLGGFSISQIVDDGVWLDNAKHQFKLELTGSTKE